MTVKKLFSISDELAEALKARAEELKMTQSALVSLGIQMALKLEPVGLAVEKPDEHPDLLPREREAPKGPQTWVCTHPKDRLRQAVGGKLCLDCRTVLLS